MRGDARPETGQSSPTLSPAAATDGVARGLSRRGVIALAGAALLTVALPRRAVLRVRDGWVLKAGDR